MYMGYPVTLILGDGISLEIVAATQTVIDASGAKIDWQVVDAGIEVLEGGGPALSKDVLDSIRQTKVALMGPITLPVSQDIYSLKKSISNQLNLFAKLRPAKSMAGVRSSFQDIDLVIVQENTEDLYAGIEFERTTLEAADARSFLSKLSGKRIREDSAVGVKSISVKGSGQIAEFAFNYARDNDRHKVTAVHQAHLMRYTDGLFLEIVGEIAKEFPEIEFEDRTVDNLCLQLMQNPEEFDVLVMPYSYGDITSSLCTGMIGGFGIAPSASFGDEYAVFEATHRMVPPYAGQHQVNPTALILSGVLMLRHLGEREAAQKLQTAVETVIAINAHVTHDLVSSGTEPVSTQEMAQAIVQAMV